MFVIVSRSCNNCGEQGVLVVEEFPTNKQLEDARLRLGDMFCINQSIYNVKMGEMSSSIYEQCI